MTITFTIYEFAALIASIGFLIFIFTLIPALLQLKRTVKAVEELAQEAKKTSAELNALLKKVNEQTDDLAELVKKIKGVGLDMAGLAQTVLGHIKSPLFSILSLLFGVEEFFRNLFSKKTEGGE
ncbi:MAG: DUF948 domain-containing protein [Deltaproteobacteria bacterium]|nr:DUF948 domain-containing protein [Deltaproteobacteria bacterium]